MIARVNSPWCIAQHMLIEDDLFAFVSARSDSSMLRHVGEVLQNKHSLMDKFDAENVGNSAKLFALLGGMM